MARRTREDEKGDTEEVNAANASDDAEKEDEVVLDFDPDDWIDPQAAALQNGVRDADVPHHGDGDVQTAKASMNEEQADSVLEHSTRLRSLKQAQDIFKELGGALGASLMETVSRVMHTENKRFNTRLRGDENVLQEPGSRKGGFWQGLFVII